MTSNQFDIEITKLQMVPERNWFDGRRIPSITLISNKGTAIKVKKMPMEPKKYLNIIMFKIENHDYVYFEAIIESSGPPIIDFFQLEKFDRTMGSHVFKTFLLLSSDDQSKTQGAALKLAFDSL